MRVVLKICVQIVALSTFVLGSQPLQNDSVILGKLALFVEPFNEESSDDLNDDFDNESENSNLENNAGKEGHIVLLVEPFNEVEYDDLNKEFDNESKNSNFENNAGKDGHIALLVEPFHEVESDDLNGEFGNESKNVDSENNVGKQGQIALPVERINEIEPDDLNDESENFNLEDKVEHGGKIGSSVDEFSQVGDTGNWTNTSAKGVKNASFIGNFDDDTGNWSNALGEKRNWTNDFGSGDENANISTDFGHSGMVAFYKIGSDPYELDKFSGYQNNSISYGRQKFQLFEPSTAQKKNTSSRPENEADYRNEKSYKKLSKNVWLYGSPVLMTGGTVGNVLSIVVMARKKIRCCTTSLFLTVLAVTDTCALYTGLLRQYIIAYTGFDVRLISGSMCKTHLFVVYSLGQFASWILVAITTERTCAVFFPHKTIFTKRFAAIWLFTSVLIIAAFNSHFFFTHDLMTVEIPDGDKDFLCTTYLDSHWEYMNITWPWVDFSLFSLIPFTVIFFSNIAIICRLTYSHYLRRHSFNTSNDVKMTSKTAILLTISLTFFVTTTPISIYIIRSVYVQKDADAVEKAWLDFIWALLNMLLYTNNAINFLLYCISGPRFRKEVCNLFKCRKVQINPSNTVTIEMHNV